jgi:hypothetical protein
MCLKHFELITIKKLNKMPKQSSIFKLEGLLDDVSFYKSGTGYKVRKKGGVTPARMATDPAFRKQRNHVSDFSRAASAAKLLRKSIEAFLNQATDTETVSRLTRAMFKVVQADLINPRGERNVIDGEAELLTGFEFNANAKLSTALRISSTYSIDRVTGLMTADLPSFDPREVLSTPKDCTHYKIKLAASAIDFENGDFVTDKKETEQKPMIEITPAIQLACQLPPNSVHPLFLFLGVEFFVKENGQANTIKEHSNPLAIVKVSGV